MGNSGFLVKGPTLGSKCVPTFSSWRETTPWSASIPSHQPAVCLWGVQLGLWSWDPPHRTPESSQWLRQLCPSPLVSSPWEKPQQDATMSRTPSVSLFGSNNSFVCALNTFEFCQRWTAGWGWLLSSVDDGTDPMCSNHERCWESWSRGLCWQRPLVDKGNAASWSPQNYKKIVLNCKIHLIKLIKSYIFSCFPKLIGKFI